MIRPAEAVLEHPDYYRLRAHLITFLEEHAHKKPSVKATGDNPVAPPPSLPPAPPPRPAMKEVALKLF